MPTVVMREKQKRDRGIAHSTKWQMMTIVNIDSRSAVQRKGCVRVKVILGC